MRLIESFWVTSNGQNLVNEVSWTDDDPHRIGFVFRQRSGGDGVKCAFDREALVAVLNGDEYEEKEGADLAVKVAPGQNMVEIRVDVKTNGEWSTNAVYGRFDDLQKFLRRTLEVAPLDVVQDFSMEDGRFAAKHGIDLGG